jgi:hypothetical protein
LPFLPVRQSSLRAGDDVAWSRIARPGSGLSRRQDVSVLEVESHVPILRADNRPYGNNAVRAASEDVISSNRKLTTAWLSHRLQERHKPTSCFAPPHLTDLGNRAVVAHRRLTGSFLSAARSLVPVQDLQKFLYKILLEFSSRSSQKFLAPCPPMTRRDGGYFKFVSEEKVQ